VIFTCLETVEVDEAKRRFIGPSVSGRGVKEKLPAYFDEVFFMTLASNKLGETKRVLHTNHDPQMPAKDRSGKLAPLEEANLGVVRAKIFSI
jgi:hypothetical protein